MKIKNNKGFTLPELLAAVVIIGILSSIAIVSVNNVMKKSHKEYDIKQNKLFTTAAQTYFTDNRSELPKKLLTESEVTLSELIKENYIEEIVDYKKELYNQNESKAYVKKMGRGKYKYYSELIGSDGRKISDKEKSKKSGDINVRIGRYDLNETDMPRSNNLNIETYYVNKKLKIGIQGSATGEGISSYQYKIERLKNENDKEGKKYKESGEIEVDNKILNDTITIDAKDFANGIYKLVVYAYGYDGNTFNTVESKTIVIDKTKPKCNIKMDGTPGFEVENAPGNNWYKKGNLTAKMNIKEQNKYKYTIGLNEQTYDIKYDKNNTKDIEEYPIVNNVVGRYVYGYIQDKAGNIGKCQTEKPVYYDKTDPRCEIELKDGWYHDTGWFWSDVGIQLHSFDDDKDPDESGVRDQELLPNSYHTFPIPMPTIYTNKTYDIQGETKGTKWYGYVRDKAGNENKCDTGADVKVDTNNPSCSINITGTKGSNDWYISEVMINGKCSDTSTGSGCISDQNITVGEGINQQINLGKVYDSSGRYVDCSSVTVNVELNGPNCYEFTSTEYGWTNNNYILDMKWNPSVSGNDRLYRTDEECDNNICNINVGLRDNHYKTNPYSKDTNRKVCYYVVSKAGKKAKCDCQQIMIDKTPPRITKDSIESYQVKDGKEILLDCPNDSTKKYKYVLKYEVYDAGVGYKYGDFKWPSGSSDPEYNKPKKSDHYICSSGTAGVYTYKLCDALDNCTGELSRKMDGSS